jgi:hypothetical protein
MPKEPALGRTRVELSPYEVAYLAGGAARVAEAATVNLVRRRVIHVGPRGRLSLVQPPDPGAELAGGHAPASGPAAAGVPDLGGARQESAEAADAMVDRLILGLIGVYHGPYLRQLRRRSRNWQVVAAISAALAADGLTMTRRYRLLMRLAALVLLTADAGAVAGLAARWIEPGPGWILLLAIGIAAAGGLLTLSARRTSRAGRERLANTRSLTRHMLDCLGPTPAPDASEAAVADGQEGRAWPAIDARDVAAVALTGMSAIKDRDLRARLLQRPPQGPISRDTLAADMGLTNDARGAGWPV